MHIVRPSTRSLSLKLKLSSYSTRTEEGRFPTELQDMINNLPASHKNSINNRFIFEAMIVASAVIEEPSASPIKVCNEIDSEACPPFSFYYTNKLYGAADIPAIDAMNLQGCGCKGICNPTDNSCSCALRQEALVRQFNGFEDHNGFMYERDCRIKEHGLPIFECNMACRCSDRCVNRVSSMTVWPFWR